MSKIDRAKQQAQALHDKGFLTDAELKKVLERIQNLEIANWVGRLRCVEA